MDRNWNKKEKISPFIWYPNIGTFFLGGIPRTKEIWDSNQQSTLLWPDLSTTHRPVKVIRMVGIGYNFTIDYKIWCEVHCKPSIDYESDETHLSSF